MAKKKTEGTDAAGEGLALTDEVKVEEPKADARDEEIAKLKAELEAYKKANEPVPVEACKWKSTFRHGDLHPSVKHLRTFECEACGEGEVKQKHIDFVVKSLEGLSGSLKASPKYLEGFRRSVANGSSVFDIRKV